MFIAALTDITTQVFTAFFPKKIILTTTTSITLCALVWAASFMASYFYTVVKGKLHLPRQQFLIFFIPTVFSILIALNLATHYMFLFTENATFLRKKYLNLLYSTLCYFFLYVLVITVSSKKSTNKMHQRLCLFLTAAGLFSIAAQIIHPEIHFTHLAIALIATAAYQNITTDFIDKETGLQNARSFFSTSASLIKTKSESECIFVYIDNASEIDSEFGNEIHSSFLVLVAKFLEKLSSKVSVYRIQSDLFALSMKKTEFVELERICSAIYNRFSKPFSNGTFTLIFSCICCRVSYKEDCASIEDLYSYIELLQERRNGKNKKLIFANELELENLKRRQLLSGELKTALVDGTIRETFQPVFSAQTKKVEGLCSEFSINIEGAGVFYSREILEEAKKAGIAHKIFVYMFHTVCAQIRKTVLSQEGISFVEFILPYEELARNGIANELADIADIYFIPHKIIRFDLNNDIWEKDEKLVMQNLQELREKDFYFCLDNYGGGVYNAKEILNCNLSCVNIDSSLFKKASGTAKAEVILECSIRLLKKLSLQIKIKDIDNVQKKLLAHQFDANLVQGNLYEEPLESSQLNNFFSMEELNDRN